MQDFAIIRLRSNHCIQTKVNQFPTSFYDLCMHNMRVLFSLNFKALRYDTSSNYV